MPAILEDGKWTLTPVSAARVLTQLDLDKPGAKHFSVADLKAAITTGEQALAEGLTVVENFRRPNAGLAKRAMTAINRPRTNTAGRDDITAFGTLSTLMRYRRRTENHPITSLIVRAGEIRS